MAAKGARTPREVPAHILTPRIIVLLVVLALSLLGFVMIYSASSVIILGEAKDLVQADAASYLFDQLKFALVGVVCAVILWKFIPYHLWTGPFLWGVWITAVALLVLTAVMGEVGLGAQRWLSLGPVGIQASEFAKVAFVLMAARILADFRAGELTVKGLFIQIGLLLLLPILFLYQTQSDLGTTLIIFVGILAVMWMGEVPLRVILLLIGAGAVFAVIATVFTGYRSDRLLFLNPWNDGMNGYDKGYQLIHSFYAFSEGGLFGVGLGNSREKYLYLPEAETDFIFAIIGEELGMIGAVAVIGLFMALLYAGMHIARSAPDDFGSMVAGSCTIMLVFQAFLNIGCVIGVLPTTGKPLPFVSSGGSSLVATFIMVGLILAVSQGTSAESGIYERRRADLRVVRAASDDRPAPSRDTRSERSGKSRSSSEMSWDALSSRGSRNRSGGADAPRSGSGNSSSRRGRR